MRAQLSGRLGNQLFELAHAIQLAKQSHKKLKLVWDDYSYPVGLNDDLSTLNLDYLNKCNSVGLILKTLDKVRKHSAAIEYAICRALGIYREHHMIKSRKLRIVSGYYQDYYWADRSSMEMEKLLVNAKILVQSEINRLQLPKKYQVVHYRCGDYLNHPGNFGVLSMEYYRNNIDRTLPVIVLTDSYNRATESFKLLGNFKIISPTECNPWAALVVMSEAQLVISSNSTLSWWGAFLATRKGGRAVIPQPFFANGVQTSLFHPSFSASESIFDL